MRINKKVLKARKQMLQAREKEKERKERTHRLIEVGGAVESVLGRPIKKDEIPKLIVFLKTQEDRGHFFSRALSGNIQS